MKMIDIFSHVLPAKFKDAMFARARGKVSTETAASVPALWDMDVRFRVMDDYPGLTQVLIPSGPYLEEVVSPSDAVALAQMANDETAELVAKHPDRFAGAAAWLPLSNIDATLREAERAIKQLGFKGVLITSSVNRKPLDRPEFMELYRLMAGYDRPIWIHPVRSTGVPDYPDEKESKYRLNSTLGWPYESTLAMARLVFSGVLTKFPNIRFVIHHCGGMIPYFAQRIANRQETIDGEHPVDLMRRFYVDTMLGGNTPALMCGYAFFGRDHVLFGSDYPHGGHKSVHRLKPVIESIEEMTVPNEVKEAIFYGNAVKLLSPTGDGNG